MPLQINTHIFFFLFRFGCHSTEPTRQLSGKMLHIFAALPTSIVRHTEFIVIVPTNEVSARTLLGAWFD